MASEIVPVEQAAREAAAQYLVPIGNGAVEVHLSDLAHNIRRGRKDNHPLVQAVQRAILAERERCAAVASLAATGCEITSVDSLGWPSTFEGIARRQSNDIAAAILKSPETPDDQ